MLTQSAATITAHGAPRRSCRRRRRTRSAEAKRLTEDSERGNGAKQIQARADAESRARDVALHRYEWYEIVTSALQIAIVLASVSVVTRIAAVTWLGAGIGVPAAGLAALVAAGVV